MTSVIGKFFTCRVLLIGIYDDALGMGFNGLIELWLASI